MQYIKPTKAQIRKWIELDPVAYERKLVELRDEAAEVSTAVIDVLEGLLLKSLALHDLAHGPQSREVLNDRKHRDIVALGALNSIRNSFSNMDMTELTDMVENPDENP